MPLGYDEFGHLRFDTRRSEIGELLYRLKYRSDTAAVPPLVEAAVEFLTSWHPVIDMVVPVPPSRERSLQPVFLVARGLCERLKLAYVPEAVRKVREAPELKDVFDYEERLRLLEGAHEVDILRTAGKRVLLFDDLFRSGATMNAITRALSDDGGAASVFALAITRTRSRV